MESDMRKVGVYAEDAGDRVKYNMNNIIWEGKQRRRITIENIIPTHHKL